MKATIVNCTLKASPETSNTAALAGVLAAALRERAVEVEEIRAVAQRVLERMDAMLAETDEDERPVAYNRVAGVVVTGNEDGAHHVIAEISGGLGDIGFTVPGQSWTYWNRGPGPGDTYLEVDEELREWSHATARAAASNLFAAATALRESPIPAPPS